MPLVSSRRNAKVSGELQVRVGFVPLPGGSVAGGGAAATEHKSSTDGTTLPSVDEIYQRLVYASSGSAGAGVRAVPAVSQRVAD